MDHLIELLFLMHNFLSSLSILDASPLSDVKLEKIFSDTTGGFFSQLKVSFLVQTLLILSCPTCPC